MHDSVSELPPPSAPETARGYEAALELEVADLGPSLESGAERLRLFLEALELDARAAYRASLVFEEMATNALKYGGPFDGRPAIRCAVRVEAGELVLEFHDRGRAFDPTSAAPPRPAATLQDATVGGLGLALVAKVASRIDYRRENGENRTTVRLALGRD